MSFDIEIRTPVQAGSRNRIGFECNFDIGGTYYYCGVWLGNASSVGAGKRRVYNTYILPSSWTAGVSAFPSTFPYHNQTSGGDFTVSNIKLEVGDAYTDWTPAPEDNASATALSTLDAKVVAVDGKVTAQATQLSSLSTTVGNNTASIQLQQSSINGLEAKATLQVEAGGTIGGVALGNNGGVVDVLIRSNTFAIAPPVSAGAGDAGKYMFQYRATPVTLPNGHVSPAGAYIGRASIDYIDATQIYATELSAITANLGRFVSTDAGGSTEIAGKEIIVKDPNGHIRVHIGIFT